MNLTYIKDKKEADIFVRQLLNIGETMYQSGGEISRIEDSLHRLGKVYGAMHVSVYALTSSIVVTAEFPGDYSVTQNRRITKRESIDCTKMDELNKLCRQCTEIPIPVGELQNKVLQIIDEKPDLRLIYLGEFLAAMAFTVFFGGNGMDACVAALGVAVIVLMQHFVKRYCAGALFFHVLTSFLTGLCVGGVGLLLPSLHVNQILIGDIMVLIPGIAITNSIRYILSGDTISSFEKLMDSLLQAFGIAVGFMLSLWLLGGTYLDAGARTGMAVFLVPLVTSFIGTFGFCLIFHFPRKMILVPSLGGFLCFAVFYGMRSMEQNVFFATLVAAIVIGVYGEVFARILKVPTTILFIPACVPLIPGSNLYYSALAMITLEWDKFRENVALLVIYAVGIAVGLALVVEVEKMIQYRLLKGLTET